jgi:hypothetical protein
MMKIRRTRSSTFLLDGDNVVDFAIEFSCIEFVDEIKEVRKGEGRSCRWVMSIDVSLRGDESERTDTTRKQKN